MTCVVPQHHLVLLLSTIPCKTNKNNCTQEFQNRGAQLQPHQSSRKYTKMLRQSHPSMPPVQCTGGIGGWDWLRLQGECEWGGIVFEIPDRPVQHLLAASAGSERDDRVSRKPFVEA